MSFMFSQPSPPPQINPYQVSNQAQAANQNAANSASYLNNVDQITPYGSLKYEVTGGNYDYLGNWIPKWTAKQELSPEQQKLYDKQLEVTQGGYDLAGKYVDRIGAATAEPFNLNGAPAAPDVPQYNDAFHDDVYNKILERNAPQQQRDRMSLESRLANQGISLGTEAYNSGMDDYNRGINDFRLAADIDAGNQAIGRFNANAASYGMGTDARKNYITEQQMLRMQPIQEVSALMGTGGGQQYPQFVPTNNYQVAPTDVGGIHGMAAANAQANYQAQLKSQGAAAGGLFGLAGTLGGSFLMGGGLGGGAAAGAHSLGGLAALGAVSDVRMKNDIHRVGQTFDGQNLYLFRYIDDPQAVPHVGLMAQEVEQRDPGAVFEVGGIKHVNYDRALASARWADGYGVAA